MNVKKKNIGWNRHIVEKAVKEVNVLHLTHLNLTKWEKLYNS